MRFGWRCWWGSGRWSGRRSGATLVSTTLGSTEVTIDGIVQVSHHFAVTVERNVKGRVSGIEAIGTYPIVDSSLGYAGIDSPDERTELGSEIEG